jgi:hypothetical protein
MRIGTTFVLGLTLTGGAMAQTAASGATGNRAMDNALRGLTQRGFGKTVPSGVVQPQRDPGERADVCSVPLVEMAVPRDRKFTMKTTQPPSGLVDPMPDAKVPAPPCPKTR